MMKWLLTAALVFGVNSFLWAHTALAESDPKPKQADCSNVVSGTPEQLDLFPKQPAAPSSPPAAPSSSPSVPTRVLSGPQPGPVGPIFPPGTGPRPAPGQSLIGPIIRPGMVLPTRGSASAPSAPAAASPLGSSGPPMPGMYRSPYTGLDMPQRSFEEIHQLRLDHRDRVNAVADGLRIGVDQVDSALQHMLEVMKRKLSPFSFVSDEDSAALREMANIYHRLYPHMRLRPDEVLVARANGRHTHIENGSSLQDRLIETMRAMLVAERAEDMVVVNLDPAKLLAREFTVQLYFDYMSRVYGYSPLIASWALEDVAHLGDDVN